jgi:heme exporter protein C
MLDLFQLKKIFQLGDGFFYWLKILFMSIIIFGLILSLFVSPKDYLQGDTVRIMYVHVPASWLSLIIFSAMGVSSIIALIFKIRVFTIYAKSLAPIGFTFSLISIFTGSLWGQPTWGTFWTWDARLTSMLVLVFFYIFYILSWKLNKNFFSAEKYSSIIAILGLANIPIIKFSVEWWNTLHQPASIKLTEAPAIHSSMLMPLFIMFIGFSLFSLFVFFIRYKTEILKLKQNKLKNILKQ